MVNWLVVNYHRQSSYDFNVFVFFVTIMVDWVCVTIMVDCICVTIMVDCICNNYGGLMAKTIIIVVVIVLDFSVIDLLRY